MAENKTVVISGGTKGIGADISRVFYSAGYQVVIAARSDNGLAGELGARAIFHPLDVARAEQFHPLAQRAIDWTGRLDVFINNAGYSAWRPIDKVDEAFWDQMLDTNLKGTFFGCQAASAHLTRGGSIINISSLAAKRGSANNSVYCASKFGMDGLTQALAKELGVRGIRVNAVCPVLIKTDGLTKALTEPFSPAAGKTVDQFLADFTNGNSALGRLPTGPEVAEVCLFLASDKASAITAQCINVDCGVMPQ